MLSQLVNSIPIFHTPSKWVRWKGNELVALLHLHTSEQFECAVDCLNTDRADGFPVWNFGNVGTQAGMNTTGELRIRIVRKCVSVTLESYLVSLKGSLRFSSNNSTKVSPRIFTSNSKENLYQNFPKNFLRLSPNKNRKNQKKITREIHKALRKEFFEKFSSNAQKNSLRRKKFS